MLKVSSAMAEAALSYAVRGWPVIPLKQKIPVTEHGYKDGTTSDLAITSWWSTSPRANVGIVVGEASGLCVLDIDPRAGGIQNLAQLEKDRGPLPPTLEAKTGGGGRHLYFAYHPSVGRKTLAPGVEWKGTAGYVVAPPSVTQSPYEWINSLPLAMIPERWRSGIYVRDTFPSGPISPGDRNKALASLAGSMRAAGASQEEIEVGLLTYNQNRCTDPLPEKEVLSIARSIARYPAGVRRVKAIVKAAEGLRAPTLVNDYPLTELGNSHRFVHEFGEIVRYCAAHEAWYVNVGTVWVKDQARMVEHFVKGQAERMLKQATRPELSTQEARDVLSFAKRSQTSSGMSACLKLASSDPNVAIEAGDFDRDPWKINCLNGTIDLRRGELLKHDPEDLLTKICPVDFDPGSQSDLWDNFLERVAPDPSLRKFLQVAAGYSLTGDTGAECMFFVHGPTAAGKSSFISAVRAATGDYSQVADFESFLKRKGDAGTRNDIATMAGARMVVSLEVEEGRQLATGILKHMTGGDTVRARFLYRESFEFKPVAKLWLVANAKPAVPADDGATWRRIFMIPFTQTIPEAERNPAIKETLIEDPEVRAAVLAWMVKGAWSYFYGRRIPRPSIVQEATEEYRTENDDFGELMDDLFMSGKGLECPRSDAYKSYIDWADKNRVRHTMSQRAFTNRILQKGYKSKMVRGLRIWVGFDIKP